VAVASSCVGVVGDELLRGDEDTVGRASRVYPSEGALADVLAVSEESVGGGESVGRGDGEQRRRVGRVEVDTGLCAAYVRDAVGRGEL